MKNIKIIIVDDNKIFREGLIQLLVEKHKYSVLADATDGQEFLDLSVKVQPDIILMDLSMPNIDGITAAKMYFWRFPNSKIIAITNHIEKAYLTQLIENGFKGCVFKNNIYNEIKPAIEKVIDGELWFPEDIQI